ncbi:MAG TPA: glutamine amidotransferase [Mycobacteriales bacterium]|jgi:hypothetical protein|nr:glutamine amidotransferase [Mycobacteriales bacterium]
MTDPVRIALLYPAVLGTYGDGGNAVVLAERLRWRGISAEVIPVDIDQTLPNEADIYVLGGGEDSAQTLAATRLADGSLRRVVDRGATVFAVCAGFQILGETFLDGAGEAYPGLGLIDCRTDRLDGSRAVGELLVEPTAAELGLLTGYENHGGRTTLGPAAAPLGSVRVGIGNGARSIDGAIQGNVIATYLHGPALARNPALADFLLSKTVGRLQPVDDTEAAELRRERIHSVTSPGRLSRRQWRPPARDR